MRRWSRLRVESLDVAAQASPRHRAAAVVVGLLLACVFLVTQAGLNPEELFSTVSESTFGSGLGMTQMLEIAPGLILTACAFAVGYRAQLWNVGIEGQLFMGAWATTGVAFSLPNVPTALVVPLMLLAAMVAGMAWILLPAMLRAYFGVSEIITTLMLNFVATLWLSYWDNGPWRAATGPGGLTSDPLPERTWFPELTLGTVTIGLGLCIAVVVTVALWLVFRSTRYGFRSMLVGASPKTASYAGVNLRRQTVSLMLISGAVAGLAGAVIELDVVHRYSTALSDNTGFTGVIAAVIAAGSFPGLLVTGALMGFVAAAGNGLKLVGVAGNVVLLLVGLLLFCAALADVLARYRIRLGRPATADERDSRPSVSAMEVTPAERP